MKQNTAWSLKWHTWFLRKSLGIATRVQILCKLALKPTDSQVWTDLADDTCRTFLAPTLRLEFGYNQCLFRLPRQTSSIQSQGGIFYWFRIGVNYQCKSQFSISDWGAFMKLYKLILVAIFFFSFNSFGFSKQNESLLEWKRFSKTIVQEPHQVVTKKSINENKNGFYNWSYARVFKSIHKPL